MLFVVPLAKAGLKEIKIMVIYFPRKKEINYLSRSF